MQKIIVLDDNEDILEAVSLVLKRKPLEVVALRDPGELMDNIPSHEPVLLLMDIFLGKDDGRRICRVLKDNPTFDQLTVVLFSAQAYTPESVAESGADAILDKPFSVKKLYNVIDQLAV